jgi:glutathione S-transferase
MRKLYGSGGSRWVKPYWTMKELDLPFEEVTTSIMKGDTRKPDFLAMNPFGKLPVYQDDDIVLTESAAICSYLADKFPAKGLISKPGTLARAKYDQWVSIIISELEQPIWTMTRYAFMYKDAPHRAGATETAKKEFHRTAKAVSEMLGGKSFLVEDRFTVADIMMTYTLKWATMEAIAGENLLADHPALTSYMQKHQDRPGYPQHLYE